MQQPSVRAASWCAAQCVRRFAATRSLSHLALDGFCSHLESLAAARSIPEWNDGSRHLEVAGLGDLLPPDLAVVSGLPQLVEAAREVSASQVWGAWQPAEVHRFLAESALAAGLDPTLVFSRACQLQAADAQGWGPAVSEQELAQWSLEA
jgi:hypothetical protein